MYLLIALVIIYALTLSKVSQKKTVFEENVFKKSRSNRKPHTIFFYQYVCDDKYSTIIAKNEEESRIKEIGRRREEYLEWSNNCKQIFENNKDTLSDRKVCRRTINNVA